jgi:hypothetical protein
VLNPYPFMVTDLLYKFGYASRKKNKERRGVLEAHGLLRCSRSGDGWCMWFWLWLC